MGRRVRRIFREAGKVFVDVSTGGVTAIAREYTEAQDRAKKAVKAQENAIQKAEKLMHQRETLESEVGKSTLETQADIQADIQALAQGQVSPDNEDQETDEFGLQKNPLKRSSLAKILAKKK